MDVVVEAVSLGGSFGSSLSGSTDGRRTRIGGGGVGGGCLQSRRGPGRETASAVARGSYPDLGTWRAAATGLVHAASEAGDGEVHWLAQGSELGSARRGGRKGSAQRRIEVEVEAGDEDEDEGESSWWGDSLLKRRHS